MGTRRSKHNKGRKPEYKDHRSTPVSTLLRQHLARVQDPEGSSASRGAESAEYLPYWKRPASLNLLAVRATRKAWRAKSHNAVPDHQIEDIAQDVVLAFLELPEFERPRNEYNFHVWAFEEATKQVRRSRMYHLKFWKGVQYEDGADSISELYDRQDRQNAILRRTTEPEQIVRVFAKEVLAILDRLPDDIRRAAWHLINGGDVVGYAQDRGLDLYEAMAVQRRVREVVRRIFEDEADDRKIVGHLHSCASTVTP